MNKILSGMSLADAATWADQIKSDTQWRWASPLHYADTPDELCNFDFSRDCQLNGNKGFCVVGAITNYTQRLPSSRLELIQWFSPVRCAPQHALRAPWRRPPPCSALPHLPCACVQTARALRGADLELETDGPSQVALKFLVHFVGDVHQPLHVGQTSDRGGNSISVSLNGHRTNLHALWDTDLVSSAISAAKTSGWVRASRAWRNRGRSHSPLVPAERVRQLPAGRDRQWQVCLGCGGVGKVPLPQRCGVPQPVSAAPCACASCRISRAGAMLAAGPWSPSRTLANTLTRCVHAATRAYIAAAPPY